MAAVKCGFKEGLAYRQSNNHHHVIVVIIISTAESIYAMATGIMMLLRKGWLVGKPVMRRRLPTVCQQFSNQEN